MRWDFFPASQQENGKLSIITRAGGSARPGLAISRTQSRFTRHTRGPTNDREHGGGNISVFEMPSQQQRDRELRTIIIRYTILCGRWREIICVVSSPQIAVFRVCIVSGIHVVFFFYPCKRNCRSFFEFFFPSLAIFRLVHTVLFLPYLWVVMCRARGVLCL